MDRETAARLVGEGLMTVEQACDWTGLSRAKLYQLMEQGRLPYVKVGKARRVPRQALIEFAVEHLRGGWALETRKDGGTAA